MDSNLDKLNDLLGEATKKMDLAASIIRDLDLNQNENVYKIGEALTKLFEIQNEIYQLRPDLKPDNLDE